MSTYTMPKVYRPADVDDPKFKETVNKARELWKTRSSEYYAKNGDRGTCVLGAYFYVYCIPKGKRAPRKLELISANEATCYQGSCVWESSVEEVTKFFNDNGIEVQYAWGNMD